MRASPVIMIDSGANTDHYAAFLTTNNEAGGRAAADASAACIKEHTGKVAGKVGYITAMAGHEFARFARQGLPRGYQGLSGLTVVGNRVANNEEAEGMSLTADMLTKDPDLVGIFADNAQMGTGAGASIAEQKLGIEVLPRGVRLRRRRARASEGRLDLRADHPGSRT